MVKSGNVVVHQDGVVARVVIDRENVRNALNADVIDELAEVARELRHDRGIRVVVLHGAGSCFCAGADKNDQRIFVDPSEPSRFLDSVNHGHEMVKLWGELPQITIAAIEGAAVGGGLTLAMACDMRVMAETSFVYVPELELKVAYGWRSVPKLVRLIGPSRTKRLILMAERVPAEKAVMWGLGDELVPHGKALETALAWAERVANKPAEAVGFIKKGVNAIANVFDEIGGYADSEQMLAAYVIAKAG
ncbi:MAG: enoyl-CoA hydratase/isomerase family protein [Pigmentiphaga sp.]